MANIQNVGIGDFNSYLILDEKTVLIDTVPKEYKVEFFKNIKKYTDKIDYVVISTAAPDASGCICDLLNQNPDIKIIASVAGIRNLKEIINAPFAEVLAKNNECIKIGENSVRFIMTPNLSWPDAMVTYLEEEKILFSGNLYCKNDETEFFRSDSLKETVKILEELNPKSILPSHSEFLGEMKIEDYGNKLGIVYSSFNGNTLDMAKTVKKAAEDFGKSIVLKDAKYVTEEFFLECDSFAFGTPTINHNTPVDMIFAISKMNVLKNMGKPAFVFGSYGWSGEGTEIVSGLLRNLKIKVYKKSYKSIFSLSETTKKELYDVALEFMGEIENA